MYIPIPCVRLLYDNEKYSLRFIIITQDISSSLAYLIMVLPQESGVADTYINNNVLKCK